MQKRAYATLELKAVDDSGGKRRFTGVASTITADRYGDVVMPDGMKAKLPVPLLWQHDTDQPIGWVIAIRTTKTTVEVDCELAVIAEDGELKARLDTAWLSIKSTLVRGLSIGFLPLESARIEGTYGYKYLEWELLELSAVTIPANADCSITTIKSYDAQQRAASGHKPLSVVTLPPAGASAVSKSIPKLKPQEGKPMNVQEQIKAFQDQRAAKAARMEAIMAKAADAGATLDTAETEEYDTLSGEVDAIDAHLDRLNKYAKTLVKSAAAVAAGGVTTVAAGAAARSPEIVLAKSKLPAGTAFTRYVQALAVSKGSTVHAAEMSKRWDDTTPEVGMVLRAAVAAGTTTDATWASALVPYQQMTNEFIELLRPATIIGRIPGLRRVPFNIKMPKQTGGSTIGWVGQGAPKPVSALSFGNVTLDFTKTAGIVVITEELARLSTPSAEAVIRQDLIDQTAQFLDVAFIDPTKTANAGVNPASITNGAEVIVASGPTADDLRHDVRMAFAKFVQFNLSSAGAVWIMTETMATSLSLMVNALGQPEFPAINAQGGTLFGLPVITSESVPKANAGSPNETTSIIVLAKASEIFLADDGGVTIDVSREASLQMDSAPTNPPVANTVFVSLWQMNMVGIRAERWINWAPRREGVVVYISGAHYGS